MDFISALVLFTILVVLGIILYLPFHLWFARKRRRGESLATGEFGRPVPTHQLPWLLAFVLALLGGVVWAELNPESLVGRLVRIPGGNAVFRWIITLLFLSLLFTIGKTFQQKFKDKISAKKRANIDRGDGRPFIQSACFQGGGINLLAAGPALSCTT